jgi:glutamine synthetase
MAGVEGGYELTESSNPAPLPTDLAEAISVMEKSELVKKTLGDDVFEYVLRNKRSEWDEYRKQVSAYELNRYLPVL